MKRKLFLGIDNGKNGAMAIIDIERNIDKVFKYNVEKPTLLYEELSKYDFSKTEFYAFVEKPIVVYGLAHQTAPFETIGRHKMTLEILKIPYRMGDPAATSKENWKKILDLQEDAKVASRKNTKVVSELNKERKNIELKAQEFGLDRSDLAKSKTAYLDPEAAKLALQWRENRKKLDACKREKKSDVKDVSINACLKLFPSALELIAKPRAKTKKFKW